MDANQFDRWTKLFAQRFSRRTAVAGLGAASVASLASPRWVLGQDDDDDQDDDDQNTDDQGGDDGDDSSDDDLGFEICQDILYCKRQHCNQNVYPDGSGECHFDLIGDIPGGPYPQRFKFGIPPCEIIGHDVRELEALCNSTYPGDGAHGCNNQCLACATIAVPGWCR